MALYPIGETAERSGLEPSLLRMWERRYGVVEPSRSPEGRRLYSEADIARLRLLQRATQTGFTIGAVAHLAPDALQSLLDTGDEPRDETPGRSGRAPRPEDLLRRALDSIARLDAAGTERALRGAAAELPLLEFAHRLLAPLVAEVGGKWHSQLVRSAQEHLAYRAIRVIMVELIGACPLRPGAPVLLAATPLGTEHEFGAMLAAATAYSQGWSVFYIGSDLPADRIVESARHAGASAVALSILYPQRARVVRTELARIAHQLGGAAALIVGGAGAKSYDSTLRTLDAHYLQQIDDIGETLRELRTRGKTRR